MQKNSHLFLLRALSWWLLIWAFFPLFMALFFSAGFLLLIYCLYLLGGADHRGPLRKTIAIVISAIIIQAGVGSCLHYQAHKAMQSIEKPESEEP
ncbi:MAG: hypothetical protein HS115_18230 [Spirochaetales bacterium]|nr:hypothetical protein [Spirochaetales bacterium]